MLEMICIKACSRLCLGELKITQLATKLLWVDQRRAPGSKSKARLIYLYEKLLLFLMKHTKDELQNTSFLHDCSIIFNIIKRFMKTKKRLYYHLYKVV